MNAPTTPPTAPPTPAHWPATRLRLWLSTAFMLVLGALLITFNHAKPRLLVLHSYAEGGRWEQAFNAGLKQVLEANRQPIALRWEYMTFVVGEQPSPAEWAAAAQRTHSLIERWKPDVLLAVGEEAQDWVARHYAHPADTNTPPKKPRVIYATGEDPERFGYPNAVNVSGVHELLPLPALLELLTQLGLAQDGKRLRIHALGVDDPTGHAERDQVQAFDWGRHHKAKVTLASDYAAWQQAVHGSGDADILLLLSYVGLPQQAGEPSTVPVATQIGWTVQHARPLVLGMRTSFVEDGGALALAPAPDGLGAQAGALALQALLQPGTLPAGQAGRDFNVAVRPALLQQRHLVLPEIYLQAARAAHGLVLEPIAPEP